MDVFAAIADPTRRQVLALLRESERSVSDLLTAFPEMSQPALSRHLRVLREAGLVRSRPNEQRRLYSLEATGFGALDMWLSEYRSFWPTRLDALERHLERGQARSSATRKGDLTQ